MVGASTWSIRRRTVRGRITSWYFPRLRLSRMRFVTPQRKPTISEWVVGVVKLSPVVYNRSKAVTIPRSRSGCSSRYTSTGRSFNSAATS